SPSTLIRAGQPSAAGPLVTGVGSVPAGAVQSAAEPPRSDANTTVGWAAAVVSRADCRSPASSGARSGSGPGMAAGTGAGTSAAGLLHPPACRTLNLRVQGAAASSRPDQAAHNSFWTTASVGSRAPPAE